MVQRGPTDGDLGHDFEVNDQGNLKVKSIFSNGTPTFHHVNGKSEKFYVYICSWLKVMVMVMVMVMFKIKINQRNETFS